MPWQKSKSKLMSWEWRQAIVEPEQVAATKAAFAKDRWLIKDTIMLLDGRILIVVCKGTKIVAPKKKRDPDDDTDDDAS